MVLVLALSSLLFSCASFNGKDCGHEKKKTTGLFSFWVVGIMSKNDDIALCYKIGRGENHE